MIVVVVFYPFSEGMRFDEAYYVEKHIGLVKEVWAGHLANLRVLTSPSGPGEAPLYRAMTEMTFASPEALQQAMGHPRVGELQADIPNFTGVIPVNQIAQAKL